jgi:hypothetical protein
MPADLDTKAEEVFGLLRPFLSLSLSQSDPRPSLISSNDVDGWIENKMFYKSVLQSLIEISFRCGDYLNINRFWEMLSLPSTVKNSQSDKTNLRLIIWKFKENGEGTLLNPSRKKLIFVE